ncbi:MAG: hypothetical protein FJ100_19655 [Deltaproteobacteria bacterium]|nr:hypothetical protein [Deltaproteobacteria bacterium]
MTLQDALLSIAVSIAAGGLIGAGLDHGSRDVESIRGPPGAFEPEPDADWPADDEAADGGDGPGEIDIPPLDEAA